MSGVWIVTGCKVQLSTMKSFRSAHTPTLSDSWPRPSLYRLYRLVATHGWSLSRKYQTFSSKHLRRWVVRRGLRGERTFLNPKIFSETNRKHFGGNLGNYRAIWSSGSSQVLTLNGIFRSCFYNELFEPDNKLILIFVLLKNFGQIFNFLSCGTKSYRRKWSI